MGPPRCIPGVSMPSMMKSALFVVLPLIAFSLIGLSAQEASTPSSQTALTRSPDELPRAFRGLSLGMSLDALKQALMADELFHFRGDRDVSLLPNRDQTVIETTGFSFIRRAFFQLVDGRLFIMAFTMDQERVDHYSIFTAFSAKYGEPVTLDPRGAVWVSDATRVSIERPLTVKYIDRAVFDELVKESRVVEGREAVLRKEFILEF